MALDATSAVCCNDELESVIKDGSMISSRSSLGLHCGNHKHEAANNATPFRFLDLPPEIRLLIHGELLRGKISNDGHTSYLQILSTSKAIHEEAENELYRRSTMSMKITATALKTHDSSTRTGFSIGRVKILDSVNCFNADIESAWSLSQRLPMAASRIRKISLVFDIQADETKRHLQHRPFSSRQFNQVYHLLTAIIATSHGTLRSLEIKVNMADEAVTSLGSCELFGMLWPIARLGTNVKLSIHGLADETLALIFSQRAEYSMTEHPFTLFYNVRTRVENVMSVLRHRPSIYKRLASMLRLVQESLKEKRWRRNDQGLVDDLRFLEEWVRQPNVLALMAEAETDKTMGRS